SYTVSDNRFEVKDDGNGNMQLKLKDGVSLDHEAASSVSVRVTTNDGNGGSYSEDITVSVSDVNEAPTSLDMPSSGSIAIKNAGFEAQNITEGNSIYRNIDGWDTTGRIVGIWDPSRGSFGGNVAEGENATFLMGDATVSQTLDETFKPGAGYSLSVQVGDLDGRNDASGWEIRLYAGNQLLGSVDNSDFNPDDGQFIDATLSLSAEQLKAFSAHYGQALRIELFNTGNSDEVSFDNVRLTSTVEIAVGENDSNGTAITQIGVNDPDDGDRHTYSLVDDANGAFSIDASTGIISVADGSKIDYETAQSMNVTVRVTDSGGLSYDQVVAINVKDRNDAPTDITISSNSVAENAAGAVVGTLTTTDPDSKDSHSYTVSDNRFEVKDDGNGNMQLKLKDGQSLDREAESGSVTVSVTTNDGNGGSYSENVTVTISNVNEAPTDIAISGTTVAENAAGAVVGTLTTTDPDSGDSHSYTVSDNRFEVKDDGNGNMQLKLKDGVSLDHEAASSVSVRVTTNDGNGGTYNEDFSITVNDLNEIHLANSNSVALEDSAGVLNFHAPTQLPSGSGYSFEIVTAPAQGTVSNLYGNTFFYNTSTNPDGSEANFDYLGAGESTKITMQYRAVADDGTKSNIATHTFEVRGRNDYPDDIKLSNSSVQEGSAGAVVGILTSLDKDQNDTHTYTVNDNRFEVKDDGSGNMQLKLKDGVSLNHEQVSSITVRVTSNDGNGGTYSEDMVISVSDGNSAPTDMQMSKMDVAENASVGQVVGKLSTTDADSGETFTYSLTNDGGGKFEIVGDEVRVKSALDYETNSSHSISVKVTDSAGNSYSKNFTINVDDYAEQSVQVGVSRNHDGTNQAENVKGTDYADDIKGNGGNDILHGNNGNDTIDGGSGKDQIYGGNNDDQLKGSTDNDYLNGGAGTDKLWGESGDDFLDGGDGNDQAWGGDGNDTYLFEAGDDQDSFDGGAGSSWTDTVQVGSSAGDYNTDWTVTVTTPGVTITQDGNKLLFDKDDVSGTINLSDGSKLSFENVEQIHW
ncbi:MAG: cadherin domain-containing protein, partial [Cohaesibacter sp.]|nr:cadherin domain-containing protein [Cohaesibacter sp.]